MIGQPVAADGVDEHVILAAVQTDGGQQGLIGQVQRDVDADLRQIALDHLGQALGGAVGTGQEHQFFAVVVGLGQQFLGLFGVVGIVILLGPLLEITDRRVGRRVVHLGAVTGKDAGDQALAVDGVADGLTQIDVRFDGAAGIAGEEHLVTVDVGGVDHREVGVPHELVRRVGVQSHEAVQFAGLQRDARLGSFGDHVIGDLVHVGRIRRIDQFGVLPVIVALFDGHGGTRRELRDHIGGSGNDLRGKFIAAGFIGRLGDHEGVRQDRFKCADHILGHLDLEGIVAGSRRRFHFGEAGLEAGFLAQIDHPDDVVGSDVVPGRVGDIVVDLHIEGQAVVLSRPALGDLRFVFLIIIQNRQRFVYLVRPGRVVAHLGTQRRQAVPFDRSADVQHTVAQVVQAGVGRYFSSLGSRRGRAARSGARRAVGVPAGRQHAGRQATRQGKSGDSFHPHGSYPP